MLALQPWAARAADYEVEINVDDEQDLYDLEQQGQISAGTLETLVDLMETGVDLNTASRDDLYALPGLTYAQVDAILEYRRLASGIEDPAALVASGVLTQDELLQIAPFLTLGAQRERLPVGGVARLQVRGAPTDKVLPAAALNARLTFPYSLSAGVALVDTRFRLGPVSYDPSRDALTAPAPHTGLEIPKYWVMWRSSQRTLIAGTFRAGFAERLVLDNTNRKTPHGFYGDHALYQPGELSSACRQSAGELSESPCVAAGTDDLKAVPDYRWSEGFRGVAGSVEDLKLNENAAVALYGFGSYQTRSVYQYQLYDFGRCENPRADDDAACAAPRVYEQRSNPAEPTSLYRFMTLPAVVDEAAGGGHANITFNGLTQVGVTGYYAHPLWTVEGMRLDYQEYAKYPFQGDYGALGVNASTRLSDINLFLEAARTFDGMPGAQGATPGPGGGFAVVERNTWALTKYQEVELSFRYFDRNYANPNARPFAEPDQFEGNRARNEAGARIAWFGRKMGDLRARTYLDFWVWPSDGDVTGTAGRTNVDWYGRVDFDGWDFLKLAGWTRVSNRDLGINGPGHCYSGFGDSTTDAVNADGEPLPCTGEKYQAGGRAVFQPFGPRYQLWVQYDQQLRTSSSITDHLYSDPTLYAGVTARPLEAVRLVGRIRYGNDDTTATEDPDAGLIIVDPSRRTVKGTLEAQWGPSRLLRAGLRYDAIVFFDDTNPNPAHLLRLSLQSRF